MGTFCSEVVWGPNFSPLGSQNRRHVRSSRHVLIERKAKSNAGGLHHSPCTSIWAPDADTDTDYRLPFPGVVAQRFPGVITSDYQRGSVYCICTSAHQTGYRGQCRDWVLVLNISKARMNNSQRNKQQRQRQRQRQPATAVARASWAAGQKCLPFPISPCSWRL